MGTDQPYLVLANLGKTILEIDPACSNRLDLGSGQDKASLNGFHHMVVVTSFSIGCYNLDAIRLGRHNLYFLAVFE